MTLRFWPRSLAGRTALVVLTSLVLVQAAGLVIHGLDRADLQRIGQLRDAAQRAMTIYRDLALLPAEERLVAARFLNESIRDGVGLSDLPPDDPLRPASPATQRQLRAGMQQVAVPPAYRPIGTMMLANDDDTPLVIGFRFPDAGWLVLHLDLESPRPWDSSTFLASFLLMTATAGGLTWWAALRLTRPVGTLARAADRLGRDVNAPPLPEGGPEEVATAAAAFNTMAARIRRFVTDRTLMLTAIGHDLRTPITRLRLRAEFIDDEALRARMLSDLDELEAMVSATLDFGRGAAAGEPATRVDMVALLRTILDETGDARPEAADRLELAGPERLAMTGRPLALKRAFSNLIGNAVSYGGAARVTLLPPAPEAAEQVVTVLIDDDGPGIADADLDRVFQPFQRLEESRSRETGGVGLGLPIARDILHAHGGDVRLENRPGGGLRARVALPA